MFNRSNSHGCPCKDCESRYEACHDHCARYIEWRKKVDALRKAEHEYHVSNDTISDRKKRMIWKNKKNLRNRRQQSRMGFQ